MTDLVERLREIARMFGRTDDGSLNEAADEITRLQSALTEAQAQVERMRAALEIIAGKRKCIDNLMGNVDVANEALRLVPPTAVARVIEAAWRIFPAWQDHLDNTNCGEVCDATYEMTGCIGHCALEDGKKHAREAMEALAGLDGGRRG